MNPGAIISIIALVLQILVLVIGLVWTFTRVEKSVGILRVSMENLAEAVDRLRDSTEKTRDDMGDLDRRVARIEGATEAMKAGQD